MDYRIIDIEKSHSPNFDDYDFTKYDTPEIVLPYYITRGCYWKKCAFCDHDFGYADHFRIKSIERIVEDLCWYKEKYNAAYVHFVDEAIPPKIIEKMCLAIIEKKLKIKWFTCIKASKQFTKELCELMKKAGAVFVSIGVESCSQKVLDSMCKGVTIEEIEITLRNMKSAKIWAHCFMINNFEGEDYKERWETFYFVNKNKDLFMSIGMGNFTLSRNSKIFQKSKLDCECETINAFSNEVEYISKTALTDEEANFICSFYNSFTFTSAFVTNFIFEREHLAFWVSEKEEFFYEKYMKNEYLNKITYNKNFLLTKRMDNVLHIYSLLTKKYYRVPSEFVPILEKFDGDIEKIKYLPELAVFKNRNIIIDFLLQELYA